MAEKAAVTIFWCVWVAFICVAGFTMQLVAAPCVILRACRADYGRVHHVPAHGRSRSLSV